MILSIISALGVQMLAISAWGVEIGPGESGKQPVTSGFGPRVVRVAMADNAVDFKPTGRTAFRNAGSPDVVRLPNGHLLAVIDDYGAKDKPSPPRLAVSRSIDSGQTWSKPRAIRFRNAPPHASTGRHGSLVVMPSGLVRLYFTATMTDGKSAAPKRSASVIHSAVTQDGIEYWFDSRVRIEARGPGELRVQAVWTGSRMNLFLVECPSAERGRQNGPPITVFFTSSDGRRFDPATRMREPLLISDVLATENNTMRAFISTQSGIRSMTTRDGRRWQANSAGRMEKATDAAVVGITRDKHLMLYCIPIQRNASQDKPSSDTSDTAINAGLSGAQAPSTAQDEAGGADTAETDPVGWERFTDADVRLELSEIEADGSSGWNDSYVNTASTFAPKADLWNPIDYIEWYKQNALWPEEGNAFEAYKPLLDQAFERPDWIGLTKNMLGSEYDGPLVAWNPTDYPEWEGAYQMTRGLLEEFSQATMHPGPFSIPVSDLFQEETAEGSPDNRPLLIDLMLPSLAHMRGLNKGVLSNAWRAENDIVDPEAMREAFDTVLRNSDHLWQGATLIEGLVGMALQNMAQDHASDALKHNVFQTPEELAATLEHLHVNNVAGHSFRESLRSEHAMAMDTLQYVCEPAEPGGEPQVRRDRAAHFYEIYVQGMGDPGNPDEGEQWIDSLSVETVEQAIEGIDSYYRELNQSWSTGYPAIRKSDLQELTDEYVDRHLLLKPLLPSLPRVYELEHRVEAGRRATELSYRIHLFKAQNGRLPVSLDELPIDVNGEAPIDPFTGYNFSYRQTDDGFTLYSSYENAIDDGGFHNPDQRFDPESDSDDYVFWPPQ